MLKISMATLVVVALPLGSAWAEQANFSMTPPPFPSATFERGKTEVQIEGMFLSLSGNDVDFKGGGLFASGRKALNDLFAVDAQVGILHLRGNSGSGDSGMSLTMNLGMLACDLEFQPWRNEWLSVLIFAGANVSGFLGDSTIGGKSYSGLSDGAPSGFFYGPQGGAQLGIGIGSFHIDPFVTFTRMMGTASVGPVMSTADVATTMIGYGLDIVYVPWGISLSSLLQSASGNNDANGYRTIVLQLGYSFG